MSYLNELRGDVIPALDFYCNTTKSACEKRDVRHKYNWGNRIISWDPIPDYPSVITNPGYPGYVELKDLTSFASIDNLSPNQMSGYYHFWSQGAANGQRVGQEIIIHAIRVTVQLVNIAAEVTTTTNIVNFGLAIDRQEGGSSTIATDWYSGGPPGTTAIGQPSLPFESRYAILYNDTKQVWPYYRGETVRFTIPCRIRTTFGYTSNYPITNGVLLWLIYSGTSNTLNIRLSTNIIYSDS
jgi:hypothetical protein